MALNISFAGYAYRYDDSIGNSDIWYRVYFRKINAPSSTAQWDTYETAEGNIRKVEGTGYFAFNLGDAGLLTQDGIASSGDRVIITFFYDENNSSNDDKDSCDLTEIGAYEWTLTSSTSYSKNMQTVSVDETANTECKPDISSWVLNGQGPAGTSNGVVFSNYSYSSASCAYARQISYSTTNGGTMYHWWQRGGTTVNNGFRIITREYDFHEGSGWQTLGSGSTVQWSTAGIYKCLLRLTTCFGNSDASIRDTNDIEMVIRWRAPVPNINCLEDNASNHVVIPDTTVSFQYNGTDPDNKISVIDWTINDPGNNTSTPSQLETAIVPHTNGPGTSWFGHSASSGAFGTSGNHNVDIIVHWDNGIDGTSTPVINYTEGFIQDLFSGPSMNFTQAPPQAIVSSPVNFTNTSTNITRIGTAGVGEEYDWKFDDDGSNTWVYDSSYAYIFIHTPTTSNCAVTLYGHWNDGFTDHTADITKNVVFGTTVTINEGLIGDATCIYTFNIIGTSSGGGSPTGFRWQVYYDPSGTNELVWTSPTDLNQQDKRYYFARIGWYRIYGRVYGPGSPTEDYEDIYIDDICTDGAGGLCPECPDCPESTVSGGGAVRTVEMEKPKIIVTKITVDGGKSIAKELIQVTEVRIIE